MAALRPQGRKSRNPPRAPPHVHHRSAHQRPCHASRGLRHPCHAAPCKQSEPLLHRAQGSTCLHHRQPQQRRCHCRHPPHPGAPHSSLPPPTQDENGASCQLLCKPTTFHRASTQQDRSGEAGTDLMPRHAQLPSPFQLALHHSGAVAKGAVCSIPWAGSRGVCI